MQLLLEGAGEHQTNETMIALKSSTRVTVNEILTSQTMSLSSVANPDGISDIIKRKHP